MVRFGLFLFFAVVVIAVPAPSLTTNSERLARNLPPLPPKFGRTIPGHARAVDDPTYVRVARASASPSSGAPATSISYAGRIEVRNATNSSLGYLKNTEQGFNGINLGADDDLHVSFKTSASGKAPFNILAKQPKFTGPAYLGGETSNPSPILSAGSGATVDFGNVQPTRPRSRPVKVSAEFEESSIWSIDRQTMQITPHWINPDGSTVSTIIAYDIRQNVIFFTGNVDKYNEANPSPVSSVEFFLASD